MRRKINKNELFGWLITFHLLFVCISALHVNLFSAYASASLWINIFLAVIYLLLRGKRLNRKLFGAWMIFVFYLVITTSINSDGSVGSVLTISLSSLSFFEVFEADFKPYMRAFIRNALVVLEVLLFISSISFKNDWIYARATAVNPNTIGFLLLMIPMVYNLFDYRHTRRNTLITIAMVTLSAAGMLYCQSRMTLVALAVYFILAYLPPRILNRKRYIILVLVVIAIGLAIPYVYLNLYKNGYTARILGKSIYTGREYIWALTLDKLRSSKTAIFFGAGSHALNGMNLHNNYFDILFNFGVIGFSFYYLFYISIFIKCSRLLDIDIKRGLALFVSFFLVLGWTETTTLWAPMFIPMNFGIGIAYNKALFIQTSHASSKGQDYKQVEIRRQQNNQHRTDADGGKDGREAWRAEQRETVLSIETEKPKHSML